MGILEKNFFFKGVENDKTGVNIPQNIGKDARLVAVGFLRQRGAIVSAMQQSVKKGFYQKKCTVRQKETDRRFFPW